MGKIFLLVLFCIATKAFAVESSLILEEQFPKKLSDFSFFKDNKAQIPSEGVLPYELISSLFSDYSYKQRWVYVPKGMSASFEKDKVLDFPTGSALIKTFYYPIDERDLSLGKKLMETRLLLKKDYGWEAVSYAWNEQQNEAYKKIAGKTINASWIDFMGDERQVRYRVPNVNQCKECHAAEDEITPIGPKAKNINKDFSFQEGDFNQLAYWMKKEIINNSFPEDLVSPVDWRDETKDINDRARSYLDINCGSLSLTNR